MRWRLSSPSRGDIHFVAVTQIDPRTTKKERRVLDLATALSKSDAGIALFDENGMVSFANDAWRLLVSTVPKEQLCLTETRLSDGYTISVCQLAAAPVPSFASSPFDTGQQSNAPSFRLLLAEDSGTNQVVAKTMLEREGYTVVCVENGAAAVEAIQRERFDLVLMDVAMPVMNGLEATKNIRKLAPPVSAVPILALTAHAVGASRRQCLEAGMDDFLPKPYERRSLIAKIRALLGDDEPSGASAVTAGLAERPDIRGASASRLMSLPILEQLIRDAGVDGARIGIEIYLEEAERRLTDIRDALEKGDYEAIGRQSHSLKSASGTFGLSALHDHCAHLQDAYEQGQAEDVEKLARALPGVAEPSLLELARYFAQL